MAEYMSYEEYLVKVREGIVTERGNRIRRVHIFQCVKVCAVRIGIFAEIIGVGVGDAQVLAWPAAVEQAVSCGDADG